MLLRERESNAAKRIGYIVGPCKYVLRAHQHATKDYHIRTSLMACSMADPRLSPVGLFRMHNATSASATCPYSVIKLVVWDGRLEVR